MQSLVESIVKQTSDDLCEGIIPDKDGSYGTFYSLKKKVENLRITKVSKQDIKDIKELVLKLEKNIF